MPEYLIFFNDEWVTEAGDEQWQQRARDSRAVIAEMEAAGVVRYSGGLDNDAPVVHVRPDGQTPVLADGPFAETEQTFGGFAVVDVPDDATAHYWAGRIAVACEWPHEVRRFRTPDQIPTPEADAAAAADPA